MTTITPLDTKGYLNFTCNVAVGSRPMIRLLEMSCAWIQEIAGKTNFVFLRYKLDVAVLRKSWLKPLDNQIYVITGLTGLMNLNEKTFRVLYQCWRGKFLKEVCDSKREVFKIRKIELSTRKRIFRTLEAVQHAWKTIADCAAGLRFLAFAGVVVLTPYIRSLAILKNGFSISASLLKIVCCLDHLFQLIYDPVPNEEVLKERQLKWLSEMLMIIIQVFSIHLNFFGGCRVFFKDVISQDKHMPDVLFNLWETCASLATFGHIAVDYIQGPSAK